MIITNNQLDEQQVANLKQLSSYCHEVDGSTPNTYLHLLIQPRALPANLLYFNKEQLVGFLSYYFFYDDGVEIALLVHPGYRRKGIARELINHALPVLRSYNVKKLIFTSPTKKNSTWLEANGFMPLHSEYNMIRNELSPLLDMNNHDLTFRNATMHDLTTLQALDEACFPKKHPESPEHFQNLLRDRQYEIVVALKESTPIGKAHIRWENNSTILSDIAILPKFQGKGFGTALIAHCINRSLSHGKVHISLDVETHNLRALDLYTRLGFQIQNACDYWEINIAHLNRQINLLK